MSSMFQQQKLVSDALCRVRLAYCCRKHLQATQFNRNLERESFKSTKNIDFCFKCIYINAAILLVPEFVGLCQFCKHVDKNLNFDCNYYCTGLRVQSFLIPKSHIPHIRNIISFKIIVINNDLSHGLIKQLYLMIVHLYNNL